MTIDEVNRHLEALDSASIRLSEIKGEDSEIMAMTKALAAAISGLLIDKKQDSGSAHGSNRSS